MAIEKKIITVEIPTTTYFRTLEVGDLFMFHPKGTMLCRKVGAKRALALHPDGVVGNGFTVPSDEQVRQHVADDPSDV